MEVLETTTNETYLQRELDMLICILFIGLLPIDTINGFLLHNGISFPISIAQAYKSFLLILLVIKVLFKPILLIYTSLIFFILLSPSLYQIIQLGNAKHLFPDIIKISRYLTIILSFYFFLNYFQNNRGEKFIFQIVFFSYLVAVINILLKYLNLGYPMYIHGDIGSRGFFYAGNEISVLLLILSAIVGKRLWIQNKYFSYIFIGFLSIFTALTISSKTSMIGVLLIFTLIPIKRPSLEKINFKNIFKYTILVLAIFPLLVMAAWRFVKNSAVYERFSFFYEKHDLYTFVFSNRNTFFYRYFEIYREDYNIIEKLIGVGQTTYEDWSEMETVEIDTIDILFAQGILGVSLFLFLIIYILAQSLKLTALNKFPYSNFTFLMCLLLFFISSFSGHTFNSGMAGPFIGLLFALMFIKQKES